MGLYGNPVLTGRERIFPAGEIIVSKTDLTGKLTYGNKTFYRLSGLDEKQCLGRQHNIVRHPEMPRSVFRLLWQKLEKGEEVFAYVKNRAANGDHYWVFAHVTPSRGGDGAITGYHSNRRTPEKAKINHGILPLYRDLVAMEKDATSPKEGLRQACDHINGLLRGCGMGFNQYMFSLGA